jgi:hypothetical protein
MPVLTQGKVKNETVKCIGGHTFYRSGPGSSHECLVFAAYIGNLSSQLFLRILFHKHVHFQLALEKFLESMSKLGVFVSSALDACDTMLSTHSNRIHKTTKTKNVDLGG